MTQQFENINSIQQDPPAELSVKNIYEKRLPIQSNNNKRKLPLRLQESKPPKNAVRLRPAEIPVHLKWTIILTIFCFFLFGPIWALYKTFALRRMIQRQELDAAERLSNRIASVLMICTILGIFAWVVILFCSVGILLTGKLLDSNAI